MIQTDESKDWLEQSLPQFMENNFPSHVASGMRTYWMEQDDKTGWPKMSTVVSMENPRRNLLRYRGFGSKAFNSLELKLKEMGNPLRQPTVNSPSNLEDLKRIDLQILKLKTRLEKYEASRLSLNGVSEPIRKRNL